MLWMNVHICSTMSHYHTLIYIVGPTGGFQNIHIHMLLGLVIISFNPIIQLSMLLPNYTIRVNYLGFGLNGTRSSHSKSDTYFTKSSSSYYYYHHLTKQTHNLSL